MSNTATAPPAPSLYPEAVAWLPAVCRSLGIDPAAITDDVLPFVEAGIRAGLAAAAVAALEEVRELRRLMDAAPLAPVLPLLPCEAAE